MAHMIFTSLEQIQAYIDDPSPAHLTDRPKAKFTVIDQLIEWLSQTADVTQEAVMKVLGVPARTFARRKTGGVILEDETDRIIRLLRIKAEVERMFHGKSESAARWMTTPKRAL